MAYAKFDSYEIPDIYDVKIPRVFIGEEARTAGGTLRADVVAIKKTWTIMTRPVARARVAPLLDYLDATLYKAGQFWLKEFGTEEVTVLAKVDPTSIDETIVAFIDHAGKYHDDGRVLTLTIREV